MNLFGRNGTIVLVGHVSKNHARVFVFNGIDDSSPSLISPPCRYDVTFLRGGCYLVKLYELIPGTAYKIPITLTGKTRHVEFVTSAEESKDLTFMFGSCNLHSLSVITPQEDPCNTLNTLRVDHQVEMMLHLGDQIYADTPNPLFIPTFNHYQDKYLDSWLDCKGANRLLSKMAHYMIMDDHEIINNYANRIDKELYQEGMNAYLIFQHSHNPVCKMMGVTRPDLLHYTFIRNGHPFFVLDTRTTRNKAQGMMISATQEQHLYTWLSMHRDLPYQFVVTSTPILSKKRDAACDNWCSKEYRLQRNRIFIFLLENEISNAVFLSGDAHCSFTTRGVLRSKHGYKQVSVSEITSSPINQIEIESRAGFEERHMIDSGNLLGVFTSEGFIDDCSNIAVINIKASSPIKCENTELDNSLKEFSIAYRYFNTRTGKEILDGNIVYAKD